MKNSLILLLLLTHLTVFCQDGNKIKKELKSVSSLEMANALKIKFPKWDIEFIKINSADTTVQESLLKLKGNKILSINKQDTTYFYKVIEEKEETEYRASNIYFNGKKIPKAQIDSLRNLIIQQYNEGASFAELYKKYNMGSNLRQGDLGWFKEEMMVADFEEAIKYRKKGEIFKVDVEANDWYYVTLKTFDNRKSKTRTLIKIKATTNKS